MVKEKATKAKAYKRPRKKPDAEPVPVAQSPEVFKLILNNTEEELKVAPDGCLIDLQKRFEILLQDLDLLSSKYLVPLELDFRVRLVVKPKN